ncbi:hypothetical protein LHJ74_20050 [Streptomyces sp. N2-109]|uniref:Uncharacterized protein n=1 Tax=Streptomyces gossypii TaxID=2883101 RepID=A0ABT2JW83_9ACTN|nr:hypothetical protein [Streptomyces gossypii]MCT2592169.1 hypothetical protein [Streptomyces gossypii]
MNYSIPDLHPLEPVSFLDTGWESLARWTEEGHQDALALAGVLGANAAEYGADPSVLLAALQNYVARLPPHQFEKSDWVTLHTDLVAYLADVLIRKRGASWQISDDAAAPCGFRFVLEARGVDREVHRIEPAEVVMAEFRNPLIEVTRMIANAEISLRVVHPIPEE